MISDETKRRTKRRIDQLLLKRFLLAGIARVAVVSEPWLQPSVNANDEQVARPKWRQTLLGFGRGGDARESLDLGDRPPEMPSVLKTLVGVWQRRSTYREGR